MCASSADDSPVPLQRSFTVYLNVTNNDSVPHNFTVLVLPSSHPLVLSSLQQTQPHPSGLVPRARMSLFLVNGCGVCSESKRGGPSAEFGRRLSTSTPPSAVPSRTSSVPAPTQTTHTTAMTAAILGSAFDRERTVSFSGVGSAGTAGVAYAASGPASGSVEEKRRALQFGDALRSTEASILCLETSVYLG